MFKLKIAEIAGENCVTSEGGQKVYDQIIPRLRSNENVCLDFGSVSIFASPFFNFAIGQLLKDFNPDKLNELLSIVNLTPDGTSVLKRVVQNSREYYQNPKAKKAFDDTIEKEAEEK
jgi:hypothetical protein